MAIKPEQPQTISGVLDTVFQLYKASIAKVWPATLLLAAASVVPYVYLWIRLGSDRQAALGRLDGLVFSPGYWGMTLVAMLVSSWGVGALYALQDAIARDEQMSMSEAFGLGANRMLLVFLSFILFGIALVLGMIALVIPGLILMVSLMLGSVLVVLERKNPIDALVGSHRLVWGHWWRTALILTVAFVIVIVLYVAVAFVAGVLVPMPDVADPVDIVLYTQLISVAVTAVIQILLSPFYCALLLAIYYDLKVRKEGGDLAARVGALNTA
jgi:hypothetical protein